MRDAGLADDKILAVLASDELWGGVQGVSDVPPVLVRRLVHDLRSYEGLPGRQNPVVVGEPNDRAHAHRVVEGAMRDDRAHFGEDPHAEATP
jgi:inorganic pyrophosphatase